MPTTTSLAAGAPSAVYYSLGAVIAIVILAVIIVFLLGIVAYRRYVCHAYTSNVEFKLCAVYPERTVWGILCHLVSVQVSDVYRDRNNNM